jgi:hypothetical protein
MKSPFEGIAGQRIAYIRQVPREALPQELRATLPARAEVYGVHSPEGEVLALTGDRRMAFAMARQNDLAPVSAH